MQNKTYLITGGTTGIGLSTARLLASSGARVLVTGRNEATLKKAQEELSTAVFIRSDSGSIEDAKKLVDDIRRHTSKLDGVFFNAGVARFGPLEAATPEDFQDQFRINVQGPFFQLQALLPLLANPSSVVINASVVAELGLLHTSVYSATKAAVVSLGKTLAVELAPKGIRVNTLSPGPIKTPIFSKLGFDADSQRGFEESLATQTLLRRLGAPEEVARLARFLLSDESSYITGTDVTIDGGVRLT
jgi:NAD(P)-dependent dehydrogenase (short-subunit alcohol dehydrogenase family)